MRYRLLGVDLDGTLFDDDARVSDETRAAIADAQSAGLAVVPCTGRAWRESVAMLRNVPGLGAGVFVTGAAISDVQTGRSLDLSAIDPNLAAEVVTFLYDMPEAVLVFREAEFAGHDYLVTGRGELSDNTRWWFDQCGAVIHDQPDPTADDLHHTLRIGLVASRPRLDEVTAALRQQFGDRLFMHYFQSVGRPENDGAMFVLEIFAAGVDKWRGLGWIAQQQGIESSQIVTIGDEINDMAMLEHAGCAIAMGNAVDCAKQVADHITTDNRHHGVAHAIAQLISGQWG